MTSKSQVNVDGGSGRAGLRERIRRRPLVWFFVMADLFSWTFWIPFILSQHGRFHVWHISFPTIDGDSVTSAVIPGAFLGPMFSAFLVTAAIEGRQGLRAWVRRLVRFRVGVRWYLIALVGVPAVIVVATLPVSGGHLQLPPVAALQAYLPALLLQVVTSGLAEEPGWRDFALPRMQRQKRPFVGVLVLGLLWSAWHLPLFMTDWALGYPHVTLLDPIVFVVSTTSINFVMTWVFNRANESLPVVILAHSSINAFVGTIWFHMFPNLATADVGAHVATSLIIAAGGSTVLLLVATRGRLGYKPPLPDSVAD